MTQQEPFMRLLEAAEAMVEEYDGCCPDWWPESIEKLREAVQALKPAPECPECGQTGGPYPNFDRPRARSSLQSGCSRCGWCF